MPGQLSGFSFWWAGTRIANPWRFGDGVWETVAFGEETQQGYAVTLGVSLLLDTMVYHRVCLLKLPFNLCSLKISWNSGKSPDSSRKLAALADTAEQSQSVAICSFSHKHTPGILKEPSVVNHNLHNIELYNSII